MEPASMEPISVEPVRVEPGGEGVVSNGAIGGAENGAAVGGWLVAAPAGRQLDRLAAPGDALLDLLLEHCPSGLLVIDVKGRIKRGNGTASRLLGPDVALDQPILDHLAAEARAPAAAALRLALSGHLPARFIARLATGAECHVTASLVPVPEAVGPAAGCLLYLTDITRGRALEAELAQAHKLQTVGQLAGGIAHDFNNLLTTITAASELMLQRGDLDADTLADANHVYNSAARGSALVRQLLAFSRQQPPEPQPLAINLAIGNLADLLRRLLGTQVQLQLELTPGDITIQVDPTQLDQVLVNLALNARAAMADCGTLTVRTAAEHLPESTAIGPQTIPAGHYARIDVEDTGAGIPVAVLPRIFEPFFTTRQDEGGTGLGLSTVQGIIRESSGFLTVESPPGRGACFRIFLPTTDAPAAANPAAAAPVARPEAAPIKTAPPETAPTKTAPTKTAPTETAPANPAATNSAATSPAAADPIAASPVAASPGVASPGVASPGVANAVSADPAAASVASSVAPPAAAAAKAPAILLVDDEEGVLAIAARALRQRGWRVIPCESAEAALACGDSERPAAVVSDVVMPGMDGPALVRALRARWPGLPAILVSGYAEGALRLDLAKSEVRFLPKPYTLRALADALDSLVKVTQADDPADVP